MTHEENVQRYQAACHAMQSGVAMEHERGSQDATKKHLRVGINVALVDHGALIGLLIKKGVFTTEEYAEAIADNMEKEVAHYEKRLSDALGAEIKLG